MHGSCRPVLNVLGNTCSYRPSGPHRALFCLVEHCSRLAESPAAAAPFCSDSTGFNRIQVWAGMVAQLHCGAALRCRWSGLAESPHSLPTHIAQSPPQMRPPHATAHTSPQVSVQQQRQPQPNAGFAVASSSTNHGVALQQEPVVLQSPRHEIPLWEHPQDTRRTSNAFSGAKRQRAYSRRSRSAGTQHSSSPTLTPTPSQPPEHAWQLQRHALPQCKQYISGCSSALGSRTIQADALPHHKQHMNGISNSNETRSPWSSSSSSSSSSGADAQHYDPVQQPADRWPGWPSASPTAGRERQGQYGSSSFGEADEEAGDSGAMPVVWGDCDSVLAWIEDQGPPASQDLDSDEDAVLHPQWTQELVAGAGCSAGQRLTLEVAGRPASVLPLWIAVHQPCDDGPATLYGSTETLEEEVVQRLSSPLEAVARVEGMRFTSPDHRAGPWRSYFVGVIGDVAADEHEVLWPNGVLHGGRVKYNLRHGWDLAKFLADPDRADVEAHIENLRRIQEERRYRPAWLWHPLRARWGEAALTSFSIQKEDFFKPRKAEFLEGDAAEAGKAQPEQAEQSVVAMVA